MTLHVIRPEDTLYKLAKMYNTSTHRIIEDNGLSDPEHLVVGQVLVVLSDQGYYTVQKGDSIYQIAKKLGIPYSSIMNENPQVRNYHFLMPGQQLQIPNSASNHRILVNGYAYPWVELPVLRESLPHLTYVSIFSYEVNPDGSLTKIDDDAVLDEARAYGTAPKMVITNIIQGQGFDSDLAHSILTDENLQDLLINNVLQILEEKGYVGLDVDFEYLYPEDRENYNNFLEKISDVLKPAGYSLSTAIAPKTSAEQEGLLYEAHDYYAHGQLADEVILMTYEWGYLYGPPRAVAPIDEVEKVLAYAVTEIPPEKILMGIPNYGYDWTLPYVEGTAAAVISNVEAIEIARENNAEIQYDETSQAPYFTYYDKEQQEHIVWFEDARSIQAKLELVNKYGLGGISYWTVNQSFPQNWTVLSNEFQTIKYA